MNEPVRPMHEEGLRITLASIGDGVIATDGERRITLLNRAAEQLTGWSEEEAKGRPLDDVLHIVNEETREPAPDPVARVLATGRVEGLANHTVLIAKDGTERAIADSAAPIRNGSGEVSGVVLIFRDQTAERAAAAALADSAIERIEGTVRDVTERKQADLALQERVKELTCLQSLGKIVDEGEDSLPAILEQTAKLLPVSWLHTADAVGRIRLDDASYETGSLDRCVAVQEADLVVDGAVRGTIEVGYLESHEPQAEGPFLAEERKLVDAIAERIGRVVERFETKQALEQERAALATAFDGIDDAIYIADPESYELLHVNKTVQELWGRNIVGEKCYRALQGREEPCPFCTNDRIFGEHLGERYVWEFQNEKTRRWFRCGDKAIRWLDGRMVRFELASDITEEKEAGARLRESEERLRRIAEVSPDMIYCMSLPDGAYEYVSPAAERIFGYRPEEFVDNPLLIQQAIHPDFHGYFAREWEKLLADRAPPTYEYQIVHKSGEVRWLNQRNTVLYGDDGRPTAIWGIVTDVTGVRRAERDLRLLFESMPVGWAEHELVVDDDGNPVDYVFRSANDAFERFTGLERSTILGRRITEVVPGVRDQDPDPVARYGEVVRTGEPTSFELFAEPYEKWYRVSAFRSRPGHFVTTFEEITEQKRAVEQAAAEELKVRTFLDNTAELVTVVDGKGRFTYVNRAAERIYGRTQEELIGSLAFDGIHPDDRATTEEAFQGWIRDRVEHASWENRQVSASAEVHHMLWTIMPRFVDGGLDSVWSIARDVTELKRAEAARAEYQEHLEELVAERTAELDRANETLRNEVTERRAAQQAVSRRSEITAAINRVLRASLQSDTEQEVAQATLGVMEQLVGATFGFIGEVNAEGRFDTIGISNPGWETCAIAGSTATRLIRDMEVRGLWGEVIKRGRSLIVDDPASHPDRVGIPAGHPPLESFLGVPLERDGRTVGMIALGNKEGGFDTEDQAAVEALVGAFQETLARKRMEIQQQLQARLKAGQSGLAERLLGDPATPQLCRRAIAYLCEWLEVPVGLMYVADDEGVLRLGGSYAYKAPADAPAEFAPGEGLVGQAALGTEPLLLTDVPEDYFAIASGLGKLRPRALLLYPILHDGRARAVLELGTLGALGPEQRALLDAVADSLAYALESAQARETQADLLAESQRLSEELQAQQEELRVANEELEEQTQRLQSSEAQLKAQQEELQVSNEELEEKNELLGRQKREVDRARRELQERAEELALASKYKSEFLANMSHELRTPLNSLLLLARSLADNKAGNLTDGQLESVQVIHQGGNDLLSLINEILDLSKIESGRMELRHEPVRIADLAAALRQAFQPVADDQGLAFEVTVREGTPERISSDRKRVEQILNNLIGNALKFTEQGEVAVTFGRAGASVTPRRDDLPPEQALCISVRDTGIGISAEQQRRIFEAFQQADGGTSRRYGGTGLGLSIARELAALLGGELQLDSSPGEGSVFTVLLPLEAPEAEQPGEPKGLRTPSEQPSPRPDRTPRTRAPAIADDRDAIEPDARAVLLIEDDLAFAKILAQQCRGQGLQVLAAASGEEGIELARRFHPQGILLDLKLPGMDGWRVLELLKEDPETRHIPVHVVSVEEPTAKAMRKGALGYVQKPVTAEQITAALERMEETARRAVKRVLVVEDSADVRRGIVELIGDDSVTVDEVDSGARAIEALRGGRYDCMVLDLGLWDCDGSELLKRAADDGAVELPPVIVYTGRDLTWEEDLDLRAYSDSVIVKGVRSDERLLDEVSLFLHRVVSEMPEQKRQLITNLHDVNAPLRGKRALVVDDDMRTLFALTRLLAERGMEVVKAENGAKALTALEQQRDVDVVLMDIMMPVLDGYETMKRIRAVERFQNLPIIALTAKAMMGDQERCIRAGASDYLPKPVDQDRLLSMLRVGLYR